MYSFYYLTHLISNSNVKRQVFFKVGPLNWEWLKWISASIGLAPMRRRLIRSIDKGCSGPGLLARVHFLKSCLFLVRMVLTARVAFHLGPWRRICFLYTAHASAERSDFDDSGYGRAAGVPRPQPIHILVEVEKDTHLYTSHSENYTHSYTIFEFYPFIYFLDEKDNPLIYFWSEMIPIHKLGGLKSIPHSCEAPFYY